MIWTDTFILFCAAAAYYLYYFTGFCMCVVCLDFSLFSSSTSAASSLEVIKVNVSSTVFLASAQLQINVLLRRRPRSGSTGLCLLSVRHVVDGVISTSPAPKLGNLWHCDELKLPTVRPIPRDDHRGRHMPKLLGAKSGFSSKFRRLCIYTSSPVMRLEMQRGSDSTAEMGYRNGYS